MKKETTNAIFVFVAFAVVMSGVGYLAGPAAGKLFGNIYLANFAETPETLEKQPPAQIAEKVKPAETTDLEIPSPTPREQGEVAEAPEKQETTKTGNETGEVPEAVETPESRNGESPAVIKEKARDEVLPAERPTEETVPPESVEKVASESLEPSDDKETVESSQTVAASDEITKESDLPGEAKEPAETPAGGDAESSEPAEKAVEKPSGATDETPAEPDEKKEEIEPVAKVAEAVIPAKAPVPDEKTIRAPVPKSPAEIDEITNALKRGETADLGDGRTAYKVKGGDTFSQICKKVLGTSIGWQQEAKRMKINIKKIKPGDILIFEKKSAD